MLTAASVLPDDLWALGPEVFVVDTDALLNDACYVLASGRRSEWLRAIDAGSGIGVMSEQAFLEVGRMSAPNARRHGVDHDALRRLITDEYLPRIAVVATPPHGSEQWMPDASDVRDADDVAHAQLARLVSAAAIYSHDRHLRHPRLAPATKADYYRRIAQLTAVSVHRESEQAAISPSG
ncbi:hypothetical protein AB0E69_09090 [Kribbella sp. NPDC026611]|uniref:hypothetical protein n=1 Tax=Kribbella sp. NPDC026611 TaxID=3154911 RepID=UPI00340236AF